MYGKTVAVSNKPWDSRLARLLVRPLQHSKIHPNHLTTLALLTGLTAASLYASGDPQAANWAAGLFMLSALLDHADGELARLAGKTSSFGHIYDLISDMVVKVALFVGIGLGLSHSMPGSWTALLGIAAGISVGVIFGLRGKMARQYGEQMRRQPGFAGFEIEDVLYLIGPITWLGGLYPFLLAAGIGTPLFALWVLWQYWRGVSPPRGRNMES